MKDFAQTVDQEADLQFRRMFYADYSADDFNEKLLGGENAPTVGEYINKRMTLPARLGGMGILSLEQRYNKAYGISLARFIHLSGDPSQTQLQQLDAIKATCGWQTKRTDEIASMKVSQESSRDFNQTIDGIMNNSPMKVRQAMFASKSKGTANFIKTQPWVKATTFNNDEFTFAVRYRMGIGAEKLFKIESNPDIDHITQLRLDPFFVADGQSQNFDSFTWRYCLDAKLFGMLSARFFCGERHVELALSRLHV